MKSYLPSACGRCPCGAGRTPSLQNGLSEDFFRLPLETVQAALHQMGESCDPSRISYFADVRALAAEQRKSKSWSEGEIFVVAKSATLYLIAKQVAPSSCEFMIVSHTGYHDVLTAHLFELDELEAQLQAYLR